MLWEVQTGDPKARWLARLAETESSGTGIEEDTQQQPRASAHKHEPTQANMHMYKQTAHINKYSTKQNKTELLKLESLRIVRVIFRWLFYLLLLSYRVSSTYS